MQESAEVPIGPAIKTTQDETKFPYQEQKEQLGEKKFDTIIVFGQGPVKPVLLPTELTEEQRKEWKNFKKDPLHNKEPDFRVIEGSAYLSILTDIDKNPNLSPEEKQQLKELKRQEWQKLGRFALNRWGRENALAAGLALYLGITDKLILSGGKTIPDWAKRNLPPDRVANWPSEAQLMKDIIVRRFGRMYQERYGKPIEDVIIIEDESTNTLLNFANSISKDPTLISKDKSIGLLATDFHMARCEILANLYTIATDPSSNVKAQSILEQRARLRKKRKYQEIQEWLKNLDENIDLQKRQRGERRWIRGLTEPPFVTYFATYFHKFSTPETISVLQHFIDLIKIPDWQQYASQAFQEVGLNLADFTGNDILELSTQNPQKFQQLIDGLRKIQRVFPPEEK